MTEAGRPKKTLASWLRRHSLTLVAALGGATGVAYAAGWHSNTKAPVPPAASTTAIVQAPAGPAELPRDVVEDTVQVALILDTSSSMDGLINQARSHLWNMVDQMGRMTRVVDGKQRGVKIEIALYEYGNSRLSSQDGYIRLVQPLTADLDKVSEQLHALFTNGGSEYAGQAIRQAVTELAWSSDPNALKFVFVAGNETFEQGPVSAAEAMAAAEQRGIQVQLIHCGPHEPTWEAAAKIAKTDLMTIDQNHVARHIASPQDDELLRLGQELNETYLAYGAHGAASAARQAKADSSAAGISKKVALERAQLKSKKSYDNSSWDLVDALDKDGKLLDKASDDQLPAALRGKPLEEKKAIVAANAAKRAELKAKIARLEVERNKHIAAEQAKLGEADAKSLETELMKSTQKAAAKKGYKL